MLQLNNDVTDVIISLIPFISNIGISSNSKDYYDVKILLHSRHQWEKLLENLYYYSLDINRYHHYLFKKIGRLIQKVLPKQFAISFPSFITLLPTNITAGSFELIIIICDVWVRFPQKFIAHCRQNHPYVGNWETFYPKVITACYLYSIHIIVPWTLHILSS